MRLSLLLLALPLAAAGCGSDTPPPPTPVVINTPPPAAPSTPAQSTLVSQCQSLFAQALGGETVNYSSPAINSAGGATTIHLAAQPVTSPPVMPVQYTCSFSGTNLISAGQSG